MTTRAFEFRGVLMKGTRLYKPAGSPLIQGRSRRERPFAADVFSAVLFVVAAGTGIAYLVWGAALMRPVVWFSTVIGWLLICGAVGGCAGVWIAKHFGWHPRWVAGVVGGLPVGLIVLWFAVF